VTITGTGSPLKNIPEFYQTTCPACKKPATRETDTFDTFMESSWYYARFACPDQNKAMLDERASYWTPVDQYIGGIEHAILHLLYARFFHKLMRDAGLLTSNEPFTRLLTQGMVLKDSVKMSKSKGNTIDPQPLIDQYGADTLRLFCMFAAPVDQSLEWSDSGVEGCYRYLRRLWAFAYEHQSALQKINETDHEAGTPFSVEQQSERREIHEILKKINSDYERLQFNTVVSGCMKLLNLLSGVESTKLIHEGISILLRVLSPVVPHITDKLWQELRYKGALLTASWPEVSSEALKSNEIKWVVQVNGKLRGHILTAANADEETIKQTALMDPQVRRFMGDKVYKKVIVVPGKLINIVV
jgi:leucyl-tRNA synthetase